MCKAVAQLVLLYLSERWLVAGYMLKVLARFFHRSIRQIMVMMETCGVGREWEYPLLAAAREATVLYFI